MVLVLLVFMVKVEPAARRSGQEMVIIAIPDYYQIKRNIIRGIIHSVYNLPVAFRDNPSIFICVHSS